MATVERQVSRGLERHEDLRASPAVSSGTETRLHCAENAPRFAISAAGGCPRPRACQTRREAVPV